MPAPSTPTVTTRGPIATFTVPCLNNETHQFTATLNGTVTNTHHDATTDAVLRALGGAPHPCSQTQRTLTTARIVYRAQTGIEDNPAATQRAWVGWRTPTDCPACDPTANAVAHINGHAHNTWTHGIAELRHLSATLTQWFARNAGPSTVYKTSAHLRAGLAQRGFVIPAKIRNSHLSRAMLTPQFLTAAAHITPYATTMFYLRAHGVSVQWLTRVTDQLTDPTRERVRAAPIQAFHMVRIRDLPPEYVAEYLNAGLQARDLQAYRDAGTTLAQIDEVARLTAGFASMISYLRSGLSVEQAIEAAGRGVDFWGRALTGGVSSDSQGEL